MRNLLAARRNRMFVVRNMEKQKPIHTIRFGRIKIVIWANQSPNGPWYNVRACRVYKDDRGEWQQSDSFGRDDLPLVCKALDQAHTWIYERPRSSENGQDPVGRSDVAGRDPA